MLEIPESHTLARQLNDTVRGRRATRVLANASPHGFAFFSGDPARYLSLLEGKRIDGARALAGQVEILLEDASLLLGDGVNLRRLDPQSKIPQKHQLLMDLDDGSRLFCTIQMYGGIWAYQQGTNDNPYYLAARDKPSPLSDAFDAEWFARIIAQAKPNLSVKGLLATEQRIPGLGNGVLQDILFLAGMHPKRKLSSLTDAAAERLFHCVRDTLREMTDAGGRDTEKDLFGNPGGYRTILSKNTLKQPCPKCGGQITRQAYMGGNVYFCPVCQPL